MKKIMLLFLSLVMVITLCSCSNAKENNQQSIAKETNSECVKAVWLTYYELGNITGVSNTADDFEKAIKDVFSNLKDKGFNTVTVQVRPCADAFYQSSYFPVSRYCFGKEGDKLKYDPLQIMCSVAHNCSLKIEAWVNPYRVSQSGNIKELSKNNIALKWLNDKNKKSNVYVTKSNIYFNPASDDVKQLIINGVTEIVKNYSVDAIHFDDYFYPTTEKDIDKKEYEEYKSEDGDKSLANWRRSKVSDLIKSVYKSIKKINSNVIFGISPAASIKNDYSELYADVNKWVSEKGYVDYICPQVYFGFENDTLPFMKTVKDWRDMTTQCKLYIGLPLYKCGSFDEYAGRGEKEFKQNSNIISRQIKYVLQVDKVCGYYIFSYSNLNDTKISEEVSAIYSAMQ